MNTKLNREYLYDDALFWEGCKIASPSFEQDEILPQYLSTLRAHLDRQNLYLAGETCRAAMQHAQYCLPDTAPFVLPWLLACLLPRALRSYRALSCDEGIIRDTFRDFGRWAKHYEAEHGRLGMDEAPWVLHPYARTIWKIGRLQYETAHFQFPAYVYACAHGDALKIVPVGDGDEQYKAPSGSLLAMAPGLPVLNLHIPSGESLSPADVDASLARAASYFKALNFPAKYAVCDSWMLDPALEIYAPGSNNILHFMRRFTPLPRKKENHSLAKYIFAAGHTYEGILSAPAHTSLQKSVQDFVRQGGSPKDAGGILCLSFV